MKEKLKKFLDRSHSPYHAVSYSKEVLLEAGFTELKSDEKWNIERGGKYFVECHLSGLYAFTVGTADGMLRMAAAHTDYPTFRIKPDGEICSAGAVKLNTEPYGGGIYSTWLDRALSLAGVVCVKGESVFDVKHIAVDFEKPVMIIPNLAIHMNREVNKGVELNAFSDMMPVFTICGEDMSYTSLRNRIASFTGYDPEDILSYDLCAYVCEDAKDVGFDDEFILSQALDNITSVCACVYALAESVRSDGINLIALYDHEEIGSRTKQGADSSMSGFIIEKIYSSLGKSREDYINALLSGMLLSCDVAHAVHPNKPSVSDPTVSAKAGKGVVIKMNFNQKYPTDAGSVAVISGICEKNDIPYQKFMNRADKPGGSTIGAIVSGNLAIRTVDVGVPVWAMHSASESMASSDQECLVRLVTAYFSE